MLKAVVLTAGSVGVAISQKHRISVMIEMLFALAAFSVALGGLNLEALGLAFLAGAFIAP
jgi:hypothetical protein